MRRLSVRCGFGVWVVLGILLSLLSTAQAQDPSVLVMRVSGRIDGGLVPYARRVLRQAEAQGAKSVIVHINTPGGRADAAIQIRDALLNTPVRTIAFVDKKALSAGALIALACKEIYMSGGGVIGAATPVSVNGHPMNEKVVSASRKLFRATANIIDTPRSWPRPWSMPMSRWKAWSRRANS